MNSRFRNWSDVRVFLAVMRDGSTLAASRSLGMAQPTVARRVEALEHALGLTLFDRDTRGFRPTEHAEALFPHAEAIERGARALDETARDLSRPRPIRITAFSENLSFRTPAIFSGFSDLHPEVQFDFLPAVKALDLCAGEADIALRLCWRPPDPDLICRKISNAKFTLYGSPDYAARHGLPETPKDMPGHAILSYRRDDMPDTFHNWLTGYVQPDQICRSFSEVGLLRAAIHAGHGLGIMNLRLVSEEEAAGSLVRCFEPPEELCVPHVLLVSPQAYRRPEVKAFVKYFAPRYAALFK